MQTDMHYYGTYAMARAAGLKVDDASTIAYAAQYVDDSTINNSLIHKDGGMFETIATAHTLTQAIENSIADHLEQRHVWVPFHFFPGNKGKSLSERLLCVKDSPLAQEMVSNHIDEAVKHQDDYGLELLGIMAHVYADTFSHDGFSGVSSRWNRVDGQSFELDVQDEAMKAYIINKYTCFINKYGRTFWVRNFRNVFSTGAELSTGALGHGAVGTYPDRPYLTWRFNYEYQREDSGWRDNKADYLLCCKKLHQAFSRYAEKVGLGENTRDFATIEPKIKAILALEAPMEKRIQAWKEAIESGELFPVAAEEAVNYSSQSWQLQKAEFRSADDSHEILKQPVYRFHQAATYHRDYSLKFLLPKHHLLVV